MLKKHVKESLMMTIKWEKVTVIFVETNAFFQMDITMKLTTNTMDVKHFGLSCF